MAGLLGGASERLDFIISANGDQAVRSFKKIGNAADKDLGKAEQKLDRVASGLTRFGAGGLAFTGVALAGLKNLADSASDVGEAVAAVGEVFGDAAPEVEAFAENAADLGLSNQAALDASKTFGILGKAAGKSGSDLAGFSTDLVALAADTASFSNTSIDDAIAAIGAGLRGEAEPLRRYGVLLDDATLKQEAMALGIYDGNGALSQQEKVLAANATIFEQTSTQQGDFARTSEGLANQQRILAAEFENMKASVGEGVVPVFQRLTSMASGAAEGFNQLPGPLKETAGALATYGTLGLGAISALSLVSGQMIRMRTTLGPLASKLKTSTGNLTGFGKAAKGAGIALATMAIADTVFNAVNEGTEVAQEATDALNEMTIAISAGNKEKAFEAFADAAAAEQNTLRIQNLWQEFGAEIELVGTGVKSDVEQMQRAFDTLDPAQAAVVLDELEARTANLDESSDQYARNTEFIERNRESLKLASDAAKASDSAAGSATDGVEDLGGAFDELGGSAEEAATGIERYNDALSSLDAVSNYTSAIEDIGDAMEGVAEAQAGLDEARAEGDTEAIADAEKKYADALRGVEDAQIGAASAQAELAAAVESGDVSFENAAAAIDKMEDSGAISAETAKRLREEAFLAAAAVAELDQDVETDVDFHVRVQDEEGQDRIDDLKREASAPVTKPVDADTGPATKKVDGWDLETSKRVPKPKVDADANPAFRATSYWESITNSRRPKPKVDADTSPASNAVNSWVANNHNRRITLLANIDFADAQARIDDLKRQASSISKQSAATGIGPPAGFQPIPDFPTAPVAAAPNVTINLPAGANGADVTRALRRYVARNGAAA